MKNTQISNFIKIHPVEAKLFHVDGLTDMTKFPEDGAEAPKHVGAFDIKF